MSWNDPNASSEAKKYDNPIPSRELILSTINEHGEVTHQQLAKAFNIDDQLGCIFNLNESGKIG